MEAPTAFRRTGATALAVLAIAGLGIPAAAGAAAPAGEHARASEEHGARGPALERRVFAGARRAAPVSFAAAESRTPSPTAIERVVAAVPPEIELTLGILTVFLIVVAAGGRRANGDSGASPGRRERTRAEVRPTERPVLRS